MTRPSVVIVGGGIAGLAAAFELSGGASPRDDAPRIELIESDATLGGPLTTVEWRGRHLDLGPDGFLARRPEALALLRDLGLENELEYVDASGASLFLRGALRPLPEDSVMGIPRSSTSMRDMGGLSTSAVFAVRRDERLPRRQRVGDDASIGEIVRRAWGDEVAYRIVEPMIGGIQAGRIDQLSARSVFPPLLEAARRGGSLLRALASLSPSSTSTTPSFASLERGLGSLPVRLADVLRERGVEVRTGHSVETVRETPGEYPLAVETASTVTPAHAVILATPAPTSARLVNSLTDGAAELSTIDSASAAMISLLYTAEDLTLPPQGTGVLIPLDTPFSGDTHLVTALTFLDRKWPHLRRDGEVLIRAHVGRIDDHRGEQMSDDALLERVVAEVATVLGARGTPLDSFVQRWPRGLPQYYVGHAERVTHARIALEPFGILLAGSPYDGVGIPASIGSGRRAAQQVLTRLGLGE